MRIALLEPYDTPSHRSLAAGLAAHSRHAIVPLTLPPRAWKWRMRTAALHYAPLLAERGPWDLILASDYVNLGELYALLPAHQRALPAITYFHENQLTYPLQSGEARDNHFALTHLYSMLASRAVLFNSRYHKNTFLAALRELLGHVPDVDCAPALKTIEERSRVLPMGTDTPRGALRDAGDGTPIVLWNHRFEYDKDPNAFLDALLALSREGIEFEVNLLGQRFRQAPAGMEERIEALVDRIRRTGFLDRAEYLAGIRESHVFCSTARHEFFGVGALEALRTGLWPVVPDALAYPELFPPGLEDQRRFLYERKEGEPSRLLETLRRALMEVREGAARSDRRRIMDHTDAFTWSELAPRFDQEFEDSIRARPLPRGSA